MVENNIRRKHELPPQSAESAPTIYRNQGSKFSNPSQAIDILKRSDSPHQSNILIQQNQSSKQPMMTHHLRRSNSLPGSRNENFNISGSQFLNREDIPRQKAQNSFRERQRDISPFTDTQFNTRAYLSSIQGAERNLPFSFGDQGVNLFQSEHNALSNQLYPTHPIQSYVKQTPTYVPQHHYSDFLRKHNYNINPNVIQQMGGIQDQLKPLEPSFKANQLRNSQSYTSAYQMYNQVHQPFETRINPLNSSANFQKNFNEYLQPNLVQSRYKQSTPLFMAENFTKNQSFENQHEYQSVGNYYEGRRGAEQNIFSQNEVNRQSTLDRLQDLNNMSPLREVESGATEFRMSSGSRGKRMTNNVRFDDEDLNDRLNNNEIGRDYKVKPSLESFQYFRAQRQNILQDQIKN